MRAHGSVSKRALVTTAVGVAVGLVLNRWASLALAADAGDMVSNVAYATNACLPDLLAHPLRLDLSSSGIIMFLFGLALPWAAVGPKIYPSQS